MLRRALLHQHSLLWAAMHSAGCGYASGSGGGGEASAAPAPPPPDPQQVRLAFSYCVDQVKTHDYENWLWITQLPKALRPAVFALRAFNVETALISQHAKSEMLVLMRCQWWRDAVNDCFKGRAPPQPVMTALGEVLSAGHALTRYRLQQVVSSREDDLMSHAQPASLAALERYADGTAGQLLQLQLEAAGLSSGSISSSSSSGSEGSGGGGATAAEAAAAHLGRAVGLAALLRGTHVHGGAGRVYLPADLCSREGVGVDDILGGRDSPALRRVAAEVADAAAEHLRQARALAGEVLPAARPLLLPAVATGMYLEALAARQHGLFDQAMLRGGVPLLPYQLRLKWALLRNTY